MWVLAPGAEAYVDWTSSLAHMRSVLPLRPRGPAIPRPAGHVCPVRSCEPATPASANPNARNRATRYESGRRASTRMSRHPRSARSASASPRCEAVPRRSRPQSTHVEVSASSEHTAGDRDVPAWPFRRVDGAPTRRSAHTDTGPSLKTAGRCRKRAHTQNSATNARTERSADEGSRPRLTGIYGGSCGGIDFAVSDGAAPSADQRWGPAHAGARSVWRRWFASASRRAGGLASHG